MQFTAFITSKCTADLLINVLSSVLFYIMFLIKYSFFHINIEVVSKFYFIHRIFFFRVCMYIHTDKHLEEKCLHKNTINFLYKNVFFKFLYKNNMDVHLSSEFCNEILYKKKKRQAKCLLEQLQNIYNELTDKNEIRIIRKYGSYAKRYTAGLIRKTVASDFYFNVKCIHVLYKRN